MSKEKFTIEDAMRNHKDQYKIEHINRRAKGEHKLEPLYLHKPERIEAYLFLFKIALQVLVLIERTARRNITTRDRGLDNFRPNRKDVRNPRTEYLFNEFQYIVIGKIFLQNKEPHYFISELNELQDLDILLEKILYEARVFTNADAGTIYIKEGSFLHFTHAQNNTLLKKLPRGHKLPYKSFKVNINKKSVSGFRRT